MAVWNAQLGQWMEEDGTQSSMPKPQSGQYVLAPGAQSSSLPQAQAAPKYANRTEEINAQNPTGDPSKPYVQGGTTGGYLAGVGETIGEGRSITPAQAQAQKEAALAAGIPEAFVNDFLAKNAGDTNRIQEAYASGNGGGGSSVAQQWTSGGNSGTPSAADAFYQQLLARSQQGLNVGRDNPAVRSQADAFSAQQQRARREYLNDQAEAQGPLANLQGEARLTAERVGQRTGAFESELIGREISARRDEIAQALSLMAGRLTTEQTLALQRELALLDNQLRSRGLDLQGQSMFLQNDQFLRDLALREYIAGDNSDYRWSMGG